jgi:hypothetical protein
MTKIPHNAPCPCGSGKKYKRCHGGLAASDRVMSAPAPEDLARMRLKVQRHEAPECRRRLMQGLGRPILSFESHGFRLVAIGNEVRWSKGWRTFHDFLLDYIKAVLTPEWGVAELAKPEGERHPLAYWFLRVGAFLQARAGARRGEVHTEQMTGVVRAYIGLAYDLYLSAHNAELPELLMKRLRNRNTFEGVLYEAFVIGCFAKAGFEIEFEDEGDSTVSHCEFTATHKTTGRKFSVEAKAVTSASGRAGAAAQPPRIRGKLYDALRKKAKHERIIFIELNRTQTLSATGEPDWAAPIDAELAAAERDLTIAGNPAPQAYVLITNRAFMQALDETECGETTIARAFKIDDFPPGRGARSLLAAVEARDRHIELYWLTKAMRAHAQIPITFDDRTPEEAFSPERIPPLRVGETYLVPDRDGREIPGVLDDAVVLENERTAHGIYRLADGQSVLYMTPLTESEMARYRQSPQTFFGVLKDQSRRIDDPLDAYDFFYETYSQTPKTKLLEFMAQWPDIESLRPLDQTELAKHYCARMAAGFWARRRSGYQSRTALA